MEGHFCRVEPLDAARHAAHLHAANSLDRDGRNWTYLSYGPFESETAYRAWVETAAASVDPLFYAIVNSPTQRAVGVASYLKIDPKNGVIEIGHVNFSPLLQRKPAATEALYLMINRVFDLGYRRCEWKCNALNASSRIAAQRFGFSYEGTFRQAAIHKGRSRDTVWFSIIDQEWPSLQAAFEQWLKPSNFGPDGTQRFRLSALTAPWLSTRDPLSA